MRKKWFRYILAGWLLLGFFHPAFAQVSLDGSVMTYNRLRLQQEGRWTWNENRLTLKITGNPSERVHFFANVRLRGFGFPATTTTSDLQRRQKDTAYPWGMELREAYVDIYGFLSENLDLRIGRQRIAWGTADQLNPTDNLNPDDLEDIFNFGAHFGSNALLANYYLGDFTLTGVVLPVFQPATLPFGDWSRAFTPMDVTQFPFTVAQYTDHIILPDNRLKQSTSYALKISGTHFGYDWSLSYYNGRDDLPLVTAVEITPIGQSVNLQANVTLTYPRMRVLGADLAGALGSVGIWAEAALFFPEKQLRTLQYPDFQSFPNTITVTETALDDKPYLKWVLGGDYTFKGGWYVNVQFLHGFLHERGAEELNDYVLARVEKRFLNDALKVVPFGIALAVPDWQQIRDNYGLAGGPEIAYFPADALEIAIGAYLITGKGNNLFSRIKDFDEGFVKVTYSF